MTPKFRQVLDLALEDGIARGLNHYYKHRDEPRPKDEVTLNCDLYAAIKSSLYEWFEFPQENNE